jgi:Fe-S-cluster containining protein
MSKKPRKKKRRTFKRREPRKFSTKSSRKLVSLKDKLQEIYSTVDLNTTCPGHCVCCSIACPQMNHSEFLAIVDNLFRRETRVDRVGILKTSIRYFFSKSLVKPCPLLVDGKCSEYEQRPLPCRLYGLWPEEMYEARVEGFSKTSGIPKEQIPLNTQCKFVRRKNPDLPPVTKEEIEEMYAALNTLDMNVGGFNEMQTKKRYNQRTWHDWFMVTVFGEERLSIFTTFLLAAEEEEVEDFVNQLCKQVDDAGDEMFGNLEKEVGDEPIAPYRDRSGR